VGSPCGAAPPFFVSAIRRLPLKGRLASMDRGGKQRCRLPFVVAILM
jgi:hypothetical protein